MGNIVTLAKPVDVFDGNWMTLYLDFHNWRFHIYLGNGNSKECVEQFADHLKTLDGFEKEPPSEEEQKKSIQSWTSFVSKKIAKDECMSRAFSDPNGDRGITLRNFIGPGIVLIPGFDDRSPRSIAVLAHELIHVVTIFRDKNIGIIEDEDDYNEFLCTVHTTLFERALRLIMDHGVHSANVIDKSLQ